eukprot:366167-Chlamydomonas_euryale.AAC.3
MFEHRVTFSHAADSTACSRAHPVAVSLVELLHMKLWRWLSYESRFSFSTCAWYQAETSVRAWHIDSPGHISQSVSPSSSQAQESALQRADQIACVKRGKQSKITSSSQASRF